MSLHEAGMLVGQLVSGSCWTQPQFQSPNGFSGGDLDAVQQSDRHFS